MKHLKAFLGLAMVVMLIAACAPQPTEAPVATEAPAATEAPMTPEIDLHGCGPW